MPQADQEPIVLDPGGKIRNVAQNKRLLDLLPQTRALLPEELLKLAKFYKAYPTNVPLGNHLELLANALLAQETPDGELVVSQEVFPVYADFADATEDSGEHNRETHEPPEDEGVLLSVRWVLVSGIGLLIETLDIMTDSGTKSFDYVIGVSPAPGSLQNV